MDNTGPEPELMATITKTDRPQDTALKGFTKLGDQVFYYDPAGEGSKSRSSPSESSSPNLIVLCSWLYALPKHIAKYTSAYQRIYPNTPILVLKQDGPDLLWRPNAWQMESLKPAVSVVKGVQNRTTRPQILMHVFSNGGSFAACQFADAFALQPVSALIIDSAPSIPTISTGYVAMSQGLPKSLPAPLRALGGVLLYSFIGVASVVGSLMGVEDVISGMRWKLNDRKGAFMQNGLSRMYIYSESDELVPWQHVEAHANEARQVVEDLGGNGTAKVKLEKFVGSKHVGHAVVDAERYWGLVKTFWESCATYQD